MTRDQGPTRLSIAAVLFVSFAEFAAEVAQVTVLGKVIYDLTGSELNLGLLGLAEFAPAALLVVVSGSAADRYDRRRLVAAAASLQAVVALTLAWYASTRPRAVGPIFLLVVIYGIGRAFASPAARSLPADLMPPERLPWLVARNAAAWQAAIIAGPVLGGFLYTAGVWVPFVAVAALLVAGGAAALLIKLPPRAAPPETETEGSPVLDDPALATPPSGPALRQAFEGLRFVRDQPILLGAISLDLFAVLFGGAVALLPAIAKDRLHVGALGLGWLRAAGGIGAAVMTLCLALRPIRRQVGGILLMVVAMFGIWTIVLGVSRSFALAFVAILILSAADAVSVFIRATLVPLVTPDDKRGRVLAVENVFIGASNELGGFESGVSGQLLGTSGSVVLGGVATLVVAAVWWVRFPALRKVDRFPSAAAE